MAYDGKVLRQATLRFDEDKQRRQEQQRQRQQQVYQQCPELESIQREIRGTMGEIIASALRRGTDPLPAIRVIRDKNLSLQKRRAELLAQLGYPEDYLSEKPRCPLCGDTGYRGDGLCSCLKKYYAQEQIRELSRMLDIGSQSFDTFELDWYSPGSWQPAPLPTGERPAEPEPVPGLCRPLPSGAGESAAVRCTGAGKDLPLGLHRTGGQRGWLLCGIRYGGSCVQPV